MRSLCRPIILLFAFSLAGLGATLASAAELIKVPDGVLLRSLYDWEGVTGLEAFLGTTAMQTTRTTEGSDFFFSNANLCQAPSYRTLLNDRASSTVDLQHLCLAADAEQVTFALMADTQELHQEHRRTGELLADLAQQNPEVQFVVIAGDLVDRGNETEWTHYRDVASSTYTYRLPVVPVLGNHEYFDNPTLSLTDKVYKTDTTAMKYYALDLGPAVLIVLNSNIDRLSEEENATQTEWLRQTLATYAPLKPILATYHHPAYATGIGTIIMPIPPEYEKRHWLPLFEQYGVKLVMNGHEHIYERLLINGVQYINAGPAGGTWGRRKPFSPEYTTRLIQEKRTVSLISVNRSGAVSIRTYSPDDNGALIDQLDF